jgi:pyruvate, water dikinase
MKTIRSIFSKKNFCMPLVNIQGSHVKKYRLFKTFLRHNQNALRSMAELEIMYFSGRPFSLISSKRKYEELLESLLGAIYVLNALSKDKYSSLLEICHGIDRRIEKHLNTQYNAPVHEIVVQLENLEGEMKHITGTKASNLSALKNMLGLPVPDGFAVTSYAFDRFMTENRLYQRIEAGLAEASGDSYEISRRLQNMILAAEVPEDIKNEIMNSYDLLENKYHKGLRLAMRSSAIGEDTEASFAGQYSTVLNVTRENIIEAYKTVIASKYSARAISYRMLLGLDDGETPMCVMGIVMVDAKSSGVIYTGKSSPDSPDGIQISSIWGIGEHLVDGSASPDSFVVDKKEGKIIKKHIAGKDSRLTSPESGGLRLEKIPETLRETQSIKDETVLKLSGYAQAIENFFRVPQDIEWAIDGDDNIYILQARPLFLPSAGSAETSRKVPNNPVLLSAGETASSGITIGKVYVLKEGGNIKDIPDHAILVVRTASPSYAEAMGRINGIITDIGSITSHLASIAREFGVPALVNVGNATALLRDGDMVTMETGTSTVYAGIVEDLGKNVSLTKNLVIESPVHRRMRDVISGISPLNLTDPNKPSFSPEGCRTFHDVIRFTHEMSMRAMFGITEEAEEIRSIKLTAKIPLNLRLIDIGGGLKTGLTTCHEITPDHIESVPMKAILKGFTHPGINWEGGIAVDLKKMLSLFASSAASETSMLQVGTSYAIISGEYMNLGAKFGYHFATIDSLCAENIDQNYISLQFSGGAGNYYGRSLRISFLGSVLGKIGFQVSFKGDLLEASIARFDRRSMEQKLDLLGRLLASSRLMDVALSDQNDVERFTDAFFKGEYDFLSQRRDDQPEKFYTHGGYWKRSVENGHVYCVQIGSKSGYSISSGIAGIAGKFIGPALQDFLDNIEAYYYFPLAIAKESETGDGKISVKVKAISGRIDRAGGIAFGLKNAGNYFVFRINALEDNIILFEYINNRRIQRARVSKTIKSDKWYNLAVEIRGSRITGYFEGEPILKYVAANSINGFAGLWTKADSVTYFDELIIETNDNRKVIEF